VVDEAGFDAETQHFLQAESLGAELGLIVGPAASGAFLVFDGPRLGDAAGARITADFNQVGLAGEPEAVGIEWQRAEEFPAGAVLVAGVIHGLVGEIAEERVLVGATHAVH
jgi:hypothetical protein